MPALTAFNRRWALGTDDFVYPGALEIFARVVWLIAISVVYSSHGNNVWDCEGGSLLRAYYIGLLLLLCVCIVICAVIVYISMKGSITNVGPREKLVKVLYIKIIISIPELVWNILGTYWSFLESRTCQRSVVWTARGAVISGWILAFMVIIGILIVFDPLGKQNRREQERQLKRLQSGHSAQVTDSAMIATRKTWERRLRYLCCCLICDDHSKDAFGDIAKILSEYFKGPFLVPTDIAAGLILVQNLQDSLVCGSGSDRGYSTFSSPNSSVVSNRKSGEQNGTNHVGRIISEPPSWMNMELITHYMKYALGSYGWPLYVFDNLATGVCKLCGTCKCCSCMIYSPTVVGDNCCQCHTAAIRRYTELPLEDIEYASFHNEVYQIPFYVAIDRQHQAVVVAVRGTLSFKDCLTDLTADCDTIGMDCVAESKAHKGILQAAEFIKSKLEEGDRLQNAFQKAQGSHLVIAGHSLGAGAATLLAILMKPDYPDLMCFAYSPPGGLLSYNTSVHCKEFVCSVVLGKDIIPRLGLPSMEDLKFRVYRALRDANLPKYRILASGVWQLVCCCFDEDSTSLSNRMLNGENLVHDSRSILVKQILEDAIQECIVKMQQYKDTDTHLYPPGYILHIQEVEKGRRCFEKPDYYAEWKDVDEFDNILVGPDMFSDHLPDNVFSALDQLRQRNFTPRPKRRKSNVQETVIDM